MENHFLLNEILLALYNSSTELVKIYKIIQRNTFNLNAKSTFNIV